MDFSNFFDISVENIFYSGTTIFVIFTCFFSILLVNILPNTVSKKVKLLLFILLVTPLTQPAIERIYNVIKLRSELSNGEYLSVTGIIKDYGKNEVHCSPEWFTVNGISFNTGVSNAGYSPGIYHCSGLKNGNLVRVFYSKNKNIILKLDVESKTYEALTSLESNSKKLCVEQGSCPK